MGPLRERPLIYSDVRYLHSKRSVDDRALDRGVLDLLRGALADLPQVPRVLELGAGVGTMVSRLADLGLIRHARYTLLDSDRASLDAAAQHLRVWGGGGVAVAAAPGAARATGTETIVVRDPTRDLEIGFIEGDVHAWLAAPAADAGAAPAPYDLVVANAFLDLVDVVALLPALWRCLGRARPFWFSINFDGETIFLPERQLDDAVMAVYHRGMDQRMRNGRRAGESRTGRHLLQQLPASGARLLGAGSSDWIVFPSPAGGYPEDEAYFLHHIVHTIDAALAGAPELDAGDLATWVAERHTDIQRGELIYIAHQIDVVGLAPG
jgi:SAM-dependent methyltransferase